MSRKAAPWQNGRAESFIKTLKAEEVSLKQYRNLEQARRSIGHFLEHVYNQRRLHSALGNTRTRRATTTPATTRALRRPSAT